MSSQKPHAAKLAKSTIAIAAASLFSALPAHASEVSASPKMVLTAYINVAGGESVMAGNYDLALAEIKKDRSTSSDAYAAKITNRCVSYAAGRQLEQALRACDEALRSAQYERLSAQRYLAGSSAQNSYVAIAYANRAVVHMMAKDPESAKSDMAHAKSLAPQASFVAQNLVAMQIPASRIAQIDASPAR